MKALSISPLKFHQIIQLMLFGLFLTLPALSRLSGLAPEARTSENRALAPPPTLEEGWKDFPDEFSDYFRDHFGFRYELIHLHSLLSYQIFKHSSHDSVLVGKEGWLFYNSLDREDGNSIADARNALPLSDTELKKAAAYLRYCHAEFLRRGIPYVFVVAPNKSTMYSEFLPPGYVQMGKTNPLDQLLTELSRPEDPPFLDLRPDLREASSLNRSYHKIDSHWNAWGGFQGYTRILSDLAHTFPALTPPKLSDFRVEQKWVDHGGGLAGMLGLKSDLQELHIQVIPTTPRPEFSSETRPGTPRDILRTHTGMPELPRALFFHDSFTQAMMPYLNASFQEITYHWTLNIHWDVVEEVKPDVIVHVMVERQLRKLPGFYKQIPADQRAKWLNPTSD